MKSIQTKFIIVIVSIVLLTIFFNAISSQYMLDRLYSFTSNLIDKQIDTQKEIVEKSIKSKEDDIIKSSVLFATMISYDPSIKEAIKTNNKDLIHTALKNHTELSKKEAGIDLIWITRLEDRKSDGSTPIFACPSNPKFDGFDGLNYKSTNSALDTGKTVASWEVNEEDGKIQVTVPIFDNEKVIGAVVTGQQTYQNLIKNIADASNTSVTLFLSVNNNDYYVMTDSQTDEIGKQFFNESHENKKNDARNLSVLAKEDKVYDDIKPLIDEAAVSKKAITKMLTLNNVSYVFYLKPILTNEGNVVGVMAYRFPGITASKDSFINVVNSIRVIYYVIVVLLLLLGVFVGILFTRKLIKPIKLLSNLFNKAEVGDLTVKSNIKSNDEVGQLSKAFNSMLDKIRILISETKDISTVVASSSKEISESSNELNRAVTQVSIAVSDLAKGASEQASSTEKSSEKINEVSNELNQITNNLKQVETLVRKSNKSIEIGKIAVKTQEERMSENKNMTEYAKSSINILAEKSSEIGYILDVIKSISAQTNLLSLNAAVEAARAGESGKGFAVVAEEIRKLAEQSGLSVKQIDNIIKDVQSGIEEMVLWVEKSIQSTEHQSKAMNDTVMVFNTISEAVDLISDKITFVSESSKDLTNNAKQITDVITDIASVAEETAAGTEEVSASTEEQTDVIQEIANTSEQLSELASRLHDNIKKFII